MVNDGHTRDGGVAQAESMSPPRLVNIGADERASLTTALTKTLALSRPARREDAEPKTLAQNVDEATLVLSSASGNGSDASSSASNAHVAPRVEAGTDESGGGGDGGSTTMEVTVTVLSLHGLVTKRDKKAWKLRKKHRRGNAPEDSRVERAAVVASFSQHLSRERVHLTHVPSLPVPLADTAADSAASVSSNFSVSTSSNNTGSDGTQKNSAGELQQPVVHWPSAGDDEGSGAAGGPLSTLRFRRSFVREESLSSVSNSTSKKNNSTGSSVRHQFLPQTCPINLSVARNGKLVLLGRVDLVINGEERGQSSLTVPVASSLRKTNPALNKGVRKLRSLGQARSNHHQLAERGSPSTSVTDRSSGASGAGGKDTPMIKVKGDTFRFGLQENAILRVLVRVEDSTAPAANRVSDSEVDTYSLLNRGCGDEDTSDDDSCSTGVGDDCLSLEGETSSLLDADDYNNNYLRESAELRTLRRENDVLHMELAAQQTNNDQCQQQIKHLQWKLQEQALMDEGKMAQMEELAGTLEQANKNAEVLLEAQSLVQEENKQLQAELDVARRGSSVVPSKIEYFEDACRRERCIVENEQLKAKLNKAMATTAELQNVQDRTLEANQATTPWSAAQTEADVLPCYEKRVGELLLELRERDAEVALLKQDLEELRGEPLKVDANALLWDDNEEEELHKEDDIVKVGDGKSEEGKTAGEPKKEGDEGWGVLRLGASLLSMEASMKERQRRFREQQQRAERDGQARIEKSANLITVKKDVPTKDEVLEEIITRPSKADNGCDCRKKEEISCTMPSTISTDKIFTVPGNKVAEFPESKFTAESVNSVNEHNDVDSGGGLGVQDLGIRLTGVVISSKMEGETVIEPPSLASVEEKGAVDELKEIEGELSMSFNQFTGANAATDQLDDFLLVAKEKDKDAVQHIVEETPMRTVLVEDIAVTGDKYDLATKAAAPSIENYDNILTLTTKSTKRSKETCEMSNMQPDKNPQKSGNKNATKASGGWLSRLKDMEEKMKERQRLVREQQLKQAERDRLLETANVEPGLGGVLISRFSSHGNGKQASEMKPSLQETTHFINGENSSREKSGDGKKAEKKQELQPSTGKDDEITKAENPSSSSSLSPSSSSSPRRAAATEISNEHNSAQQSLLQSVEWVEKELLSGIIINNQAPSTATAVGRVPCILQGETARPNSNNELDFQDVESKFTNHGKIVSHMPDPTTRLSEQRNQTADKDYASSTCIDDSSVSEAKQKATQESSQAEQKYSSERNEKQEEGTSEKNAQTKQQNSATESVDEDNSGKENPGASENLVT